MFILLDNYDSFTWNLHHYLCEIGVKTEVVRNDILTPQRILSENPSAIVISPGPSTPDEAGISLDLIRLAALNHVPVLGVCLGHQAIGQVFGAKVVRAPRPMHGKTSLISHGGAGIFAGLPAPFRATRYHSLMVERSSIPGCLDVTAWSEDGLAMGLHHKELPIFGVQFHPESIASEHGHALLMNFAEIARKHQNEPQETFP